MIYKDFKIYLPGETVNLKPLELKVFQWDERCVYQDETTIICPDNEYLINTYTLDYYEYFKSVMVNGNNITQNDPEILNFSSIFENKWTSNNYMILSTPQTFTMPNQDVWFKTYIK